MNYVLGSAIKILSEPSVTTGSTCVLKSLVDPAGTEVLTNESMSLEVQDDGTYAFVYVFQSVDGTHDIGRYKYVTKVTNGTKINLAKSYFFLEEE